jgi:hypothetical protein
MRVVIDRFEGEYAVCERDDRTMMNIPRKGLPTGVKEGDALVIDGDTVAVDRRKTRLNKQDARKLMDELWK